nr:hypothetical protein Q903MT_gene1332 [Picea sitchensis]
MVALITGVSALPAAYQLNRGKLDTGASFNYGRIRKALLSKLRVYAPSLCTLARSISLRRFYLFSLVLGAMIICFIQYVITFIIGRVTADGSGAEGKRAEGRGSAGGNWTCRINEPHLGSDHLRLVMNTRPGITLIFFLIRPPQAYSEAELTYLEFLEPFFLPHDLSHYYIMLFSCYIL